MAKRGGNPKNLKPFKKGDPSPNPGGRPKMPEDIRKVARMNRDDFSRFVHEYLQMNRAEIQESLQNPHATMLQLMVGGIVARASKDQDHNRANWLAEQVFGKLKDQIEIATDFRSLSDEALITIGRQAILLLSGEKV